MYSSLNTRKQRNKTPMYHSMYNPYASYSTEAFHKSEMKLDYDNEIFLQNLHLYPDPLKKNLADSLPTSETAVKVRKSNLEVPKIVQMPPKPQDVRSDSALSGITTFFSGFMNMLSGAMFRTKSPVDFYDCYEESQQGSPPIWHPSKIDAQDKNGQTLDELSYNGLPNETMNAVKTCEQKLNNVKCLLQNPKPKLNGEKSNWRKRPKKVFVEPGSVEDTFEDAISMEDFVTLSNKTCIEHFSPVQHHYEDKSITIAAKTKTEAPIENMEIVNHIDTDNERTKANLNDETNGICVKDKDITDVVEPKKDTTNVQQNDNADVNEPKKDTTNVQQNDNTDIKLMKDTTNVEHNRNTKEIEVNDIQLKKCELVIVCEDKISKLKALLQDKCKKNNKVLSKPVSIEHRPTKSIPIIKPVDKHFKNPCRMLDKRCKLKMKNNIQDDANFANEISQSPDSSPIITSSINSSDASLGDYFDELKGRFRTVSATESEDSFQIVFHEPKRNSDCDSEDSFIVFEDSPNCYTTNDVFGDSDSELSDSGCSTMKLSHSLSRTVSNLTDDTLFESGDEVDCARVKREGLLLDAKKKILRKDQPAKKVHFSLEPPTVKVMRVWAFASRQARAGHWERFALDRERFKRRIADVDMAVSWVLKPQHRSRVMFQRFMPWWNQQKRKEIAEKKEAKLLEDARKTEEEIESKNKEIAEREEQAHQDEERQREIDTKIENNYEQDNSSMSEYLKYRNESRNCDKN